MSTEPTDDLPPEPVKKKKKKKKKKRAAEMAPPPPPAEASKEMPFGWVVAGALVALGIGAATYKLVSSPKQEVTVGGDPAKASAEPPADHAALRDPALATEKAPERFKVTFETTKGKFVIESNRQWAPNGVDRFYNLVKIGFFRDVAFFRAVKGFMVQFGIHGDPDISKHWRDATIAPDPVKESNKRGFLTFAMAGSPDTRSTQFFISYGDNARLDQMGFAPIGQVVEGMDVVDKLHQGYGETPSRAQGTIQQKGNAFLREKFPDLDYIKSARIEP